MFQDHSQNIKYDSNQMLQLKRICKKLDLDAKNIILKVAEVLQGNWKKIANYTYFYACLFSWLIFAKAKPPVKK